VCQCLRLLRLLVLDALQLAGQLELDVVEGRTHRTHQLLEPGLDEDVGVLDRLINGLLVDQVELGDGEGAQPEQNEESECVEHAANQVGAVKENSRQD